MPFSITFEPAWAVQYMKYRSSWYFYFIASFFPPQQRGKQDRSLGGKAYFCLFTFPPKGSQNGWRRKPGPIRLWFYHIFKFFSSVSNHRRKGPTSGPRRRRVAAAAAALSSVWNPTKRNGSKTNDVSSEVSIPFPLSSGGGVGQVAICDERPVAGWQHKIAQRIKGNPGCWRRWRCRLQREGIPKKVGKRE